MAEMSHKYNQLTSEYPTMWLQWVL